MSSRVELNLSIAELSAMREEVVGFFRANAIVADPTHEEKRFYVWAPWVNNETNPVIQRKVATVMAHRFGHLRVTKAMGVPDMGKGLGQLVAVDLQVPHISARKDGRIPASWIDPIITAPIESFTTDAAPRIAIYRNGDLTAPGSHVLLVDDFIDDGSTLTEVAGALLHAGVQKVSAAVHVAKLFRGGVDRLREMGVDAFYVVGITGINGSSIEVI